MKPTKLLKQYTQIENLLKLEHSVLSRRIEFISGWGIAEHIDHCLKVSARLLGGLSNPTISEENGINAIGRVILLVGIIPKGRNAPSFTLPTTASIEELHHALTHARVLLAEVTKDSQVVRSREKVFKHPIFGWLTRAQALRFLEVHTNHHLKIIRKIRAAL